MPDAARIATVSRGLPAASRMIRWNASLATIWSSASHSSSSRSTSSAVMRRRGARGGVRLEQRAHLVEVEQVVAVERAHDRAAVGLDVDQPLRLELQQRLADRRARRPEALRERLRPQPLARLQVAFEDRLLQQVAHTRTGGILHTKSRDHAVAQGPLERDCMQSAHGALRPRSRPRLVLAAAVSGSRSTGDSAHESSRLGGGGLVPARAASSATAATGSTRGFGCSGGGVGGRHAGPARRAGAAVRATSTAASSISEQDQRDQRG